MGTSDSDNIKMTSSAVILLVLFSFSSSQPLQESPAEEISAAYENFVAACQSAGIPPSFFGPPILPVEQQEQSRSDVSQVSIQAPNMALRTFNLFRPKPTYNSGYNTGYNN